MTVGELLKKLQGVDPETKISIYSNEDISMYDCERVTDYEILNAFKGPANFCIKVKPGESRMIE